MKRKYDLVAAEKKHNKKRKKKSNKDQEMQMTSFETLMPEEKHVYLTQTQRSEPVSTAALPEEAREPVLPSASQKQVPDPVSSVSQEQVPDPVQYDESVAQASSTAVNQSDVILDNMIKQVQQQAEKFELEYDEEQWLDSEEELPLEKQDIQMQNLYSAMRAASNNVNSMNEAENMWRTLKENFTTFLSEAPDASAVAKIRDQWIQYCHQALNIKSQSLEDLYQGIEDSNPSVQRNSNVQSLAQQFEEGASADKRSEDVVNNHMHSEIKERSEGFSKLQSFWENTAALSTAKEGSAATSKSERFSEMKDFWENQAELITVKEAGATKKNMQKQDKDQESLEETRGKVNTSFENVDNVIEHTSKNIVRDNGAGRSLGNYD